MITLSWWTIILFLLIMAIISGLGGIIVGIRLRKKDDFQKRQDSMAATIMTTNDGAIAMIVVDGCIVPNVQFVNMDKLLHEGTGELDDEF